MQELRQSTVITFQLGPFVDSTDGDTAETALTITQSDVLLSKNGAAFAQKNDANAAPHDTVGWYRCQINATDTGTLGRLIVQVRESGALVVWREFQVIAQDVWDMKYLNGLSDISDDILATTIEGSENWLEVMRYLLAFVGGKANGGGSSPVNFRDQADSKNRIAMTVDADGNRSAVSLDGS